MIIQKYKSEKTSINTVTKVYKRFNFKSNSLILDYGGGKYDTNKKFMEDKGHKLLVYDPYNRDSNHNNKVLDEINVHNGADIIVCANVLNVILEDEIIDDILENLMKYTNEFSIIYIQIYEGDKSGIGKVTSKGFQRNLKSSYYISYLEKIFKDYNIRQFGNIFELTRKRYD